MSTVAAVALTWDEVQAMPEPIRARVAYEWRMRCQARRVRAAEDIEDALLTGIQAAQILALITPDPPALVAARRRVLLTDRNWGMTPNPTTTGAAS